MARSELEVSLLEGRPQGVNLRPCFPHLTLMMRGAQISRPLVLLIAAMAVGSAVASSQLPQLQALISSAEPLLLSKLLNEGRIDEARSRSRITVDGLFLGHSGFFAVNSSSERHVNQMFFWFQPCTACSASAAPLIQWFNGGPGSPDTIGVFNQNRPALCDTVARAS